MERLDNRVANSLTRFYIVALCLVALLTISGLLLIRRTISRLSHDSSIVNVAGRQRMLSQRLTKQAILMSEKISSGDRMEFDTLLILWTNSQHQLAGHRLPLEKGSVVWKSAVLDSMFTDIVPVFESLRDDFLATAKDSSDQVARASALKKILANEPVYLGKMNDIVFEFDKESFEKLENLERIELILAVMTIFVLIAEGVLIFRPAVNTTRRVVRMLTEAENALQDSNQKLKEANQHLTETQQELLNVQREKFELQMSENRVRAAALIEGQEEERKRFALELHDGIGQMLTGLKLHAEKLKTVEFKDEKHQKRFQQLAALIQETIRTTRQVSFNLMPSVLTDFGLAAALRLLCEQTRASSDLNVRFDENTTGQAGVPDMIAIGIYRIAQEALHNAIKHAQAKLITVSLTKNDETIQLEVTDDGTGFAAGDMHIRKEISVSQHGMESIRTRALLMNGNLEIASEIGGGTRLIVSVQYHVV